MATPRDNISILECEDEAEFTEHDGEFRGFTLEDLEAAVAMVIGGDSDEENNGTEDEIDLGRVIARGDANEDDQPSALIIFMLVKHYQPTRSA